VLRNKYIAFIIIISIIITIDENNKNIRSVSYDVLTRPCHQVAAYPQVAKEKTSNR